MSYYYYHLPPPGEVEDSASTTGSLRHQNSRNPQPQSSHQYQHCHDNRPYRPQSSTDSIPFVDADASSGQPRATNLSYDLGTSSSEETVNRHSTFPHINKPRITSSTGATSVRLRRRYPPPPPSPPATFLDSEDAASLNNLLDALDDLDVVEEDRLSSLTTTGSSRDDEVAVEEEPVVTRNGPPRPTLASILVSIPPPPTPPPPENEDRDDGQERHQQQREQQLRQPVRRSGLYSATQRSNHNARFIPLRQPTSPPKDYNQLKVSITPDSL
jgi:hypothetical protein